MHLFRQDPSIDQSRCNDQIASMKAELDELLQARDTDHSTALFHACFAPTFYSKQENTFGTLTVLASQACDNCSTYNHISRLETSNKGAELHWNWSSSFLTSILEHPQFDVWGILREQLTQLSTPLMKTLPCFLQQIDDPNTTISGVLLWNERWCSLSLIEAYEHLRMLFEEILLQVYQLSRCVSWTNTYAGNPWCSTREPTETATILIPPLYPDGWCEYGTST